MTIAGIQQFGLTPEDYELIQNDNRKKSSKFKHILPSVISMKKEKTFTSCCQTNQQYNEDIEFFDRFVFEQRNGFYVVFQYITTFLFAVSSILYAFMSTFRYN